jgi:transcriptional regulator GlxA family with amidase domain
LAVETLAQLLGISKRTFELQFRVTVGCSPRDEIQRIRCERAQELLRDTLFSVTRIASMVGFAETAAFSKFFRKQTGLSPSDYRERLCRCPRQPFRL